jgi:hypothetical protein
MGAKKKKLTTRSDTNLESLSLYTFFLDRASESNDLYDALKAIGARVERHRDYFEDNEDDPIWLPEVASKGWVIISQNQFNELERQAIRNANGRAFLIVHGDLRAEEEATMVVASLPKMLRILKANPPPFIARIYNPKKILMTSSEFRAHSKLSG